MKTVKDLLSDRIAVAGLIVYLGLAVAWSFVIPLGGGIDEPRHFQYLEIIAEQYRLPSAAERARAISHHPPLHYILAAPVYAATSGLSRDAQWHAVRLWNVLVGAVTLLFIFLMLRRLFPDRARVARFGLIFAGWLPHYLLICAMHSNDITTALFGTITLYLAIRLLTEEGNWKIAALAGLAAGAAVLCKHNALVVAFPAGVAVALSPLTGSREDSEARENSEKTLTPVQRIVRSGGAFFVAFMVTGGAWLVSFFAQWGRLDSDPPWPEWQWPVHTFVGKLFRAISGLYRSTWAQVGWLPGPHSPPPPGPSAGFPRPDLETPLLLFVFPVALLAIVGTAVLIMRGFRRGRSAQAAGVLLLVGTSALTYATLTHNAMYINPGRFEAGRYALPAVAATFSLAAIGPMALKALHRRIAWWWLAGLLLVMNAVAMYEMFAYLIPTFA